jgi:hypothetical protein
MTPESFVARCFDNNVEAFKTMLNDLDEFAPNLKANLESFINYANLGYKVNSVVRERRHKTSEMPYVHLTMGLRNGDVPLMLFSEGKLISFLQDYQAGKLKVEFSFQELMNYINS